MAAGDRTPDSWAALGFDSVRISVHGSASRGGHSKSTGRRSSDAGVWPRHAAGDGGDGIYSVSAEPGSAIAALSAGRLDYGVDRHPTAAENRRHDD